MYSQTAEQILRNTECKSSTNNIKSDCYCCHKFSFMTAFFLHSIDLIGYVLHNSCKEIIAFMKANNSHDSRLHNS